MFSLFLSNPILFLIYAVSLLFTISIHEFAHALMADRLGDPTAKLQGRLTLNPRAHLDFWGTILLFLYGFGWGKPVPFDPYNLKNPRRDAALISLAGPMANFIILLILAILLRLLNFFNLEILYVIQGFFTPMIYLNIILGVFNLIPIHPLDGFKVVAGLLPENKVDEWESLRSYGFLFLLLLIIPFGGSSMINSIIQPAITLIIRLVLPSSIPGISGII